jgi:hypothetical protein
MSIKERLKNEGFSDEQIDKIRKILYEGWMKEIFDFLEEVEDKR